MADFRGLGGRSPANPRQHWSSHVSRFRLRLPLAQCLGSFLRTNGRKSGSSLRLRPSPFCGCVQPQANWVLPRHKAIRGARARHPASDRPQNRVTARGYRLPAVDAVHLGHGCEPRPRTGLHRRGGICACAGTGTGWRAFGWVGGCEPQTLQTLFSDRTVAKCCARALLIGISPGRTPFAWGITALTDHNNGR